MNELIEILTLILKKSEKNKDGSLYVHKWIKNKIVKTLNDSRKKEKKLDKKKSKAPKIENNNIEESKVVSNSLGKEFKNSGWGRRKTRNKGYKKIRHEYL